MTERRADLARVTLSVLFIGGLIDGSLWILALLGATAWAYYSLGVGWGTFLLVWSLVVGFMDNVLRPLLIRRGADLPLLLIFAGVIGGLVAFGIVGVFVGPVVLAVAYTLLDDWVSIGSPDSATAAPMVDG
jgi:predicted PurR-regulated permease PerM